MLSRLLFLFEPELLAFFGPAHFYHHRFIPWIQGGGDPFDLHLDLLTHHIKGFGIIWDPDYDYALLIISFVILEGKHDLIIILVDDVHMICSMGKDTGSRRQFEAVLMKLR